MPSLQRCSLAWIHAFTIALLAATAVRAQTVDMQTGQATREPVVTGAPYSADTTITVKLTMFDTPVEQQVAARVYRDSAGRVRREQTVTGLELPGPSDRSDLVVTIIDPVAELIYTLNPATKTAYRMPIDSSTSATIFPGAPPLPVARSRTEEPLGTRQMGGITVVGRRTVVTLPGSQVADGRQIEISDELWESPDLRVLVLARHLDPRTGEFEHRLTNINRAEPPRNLFTIPSTYTIVDVPPPPFSR